MLDLPTMNVIYKLLLVGGPETTTAELHSFTSRKFYSLRLSLIFLSESTANKAEIWNVPSPQEGYVENTILDRSDIKDDSWGREYKHFLMICNPGKVHYPSLYLSQCKFERCLEARSLNLANLELGRCQ